MKIKNVIFDLGGVLIDWNPEYVYLKEFRGNREKMKWFFDHVCTHDWNEQQDAGISMKTATEDRVALFPEYEDLIRMFYGRWEEMLGYEITESVEILNSLRQNPSINLYALTNWSHETFPVALQRFEFLSWFKGIVVSGAEKLIKPDPKIYELILNRYHLVASESIFIDDRLANTQGAEKVGIQGIHFTNAKSLQQSLQTLIHKNHI